MSYRNAVRAQFLATPWATAVAFLLVLQLVSRFVPVLTVDFVRDDWHAWASVASESAWRHAAVQALHNPLRPIANLASVVAFRLLGHEPWRFTVLSVVAHSCILLILLSLVLRVAGDRRTAFLFGLIYAILPNLTETFRWNTLVVSFAALAMPLWLATAWGWVRYLETSRRGYWVLSAGAFAVAVFVYEIGAFLPIAFLCLAPVREWRRRILDLLPFGAILAALFVWRSTNALGMGVSVYWPGTYKMGWDWASVVWNVRQTVAWWFGPRMLACVAHGWRAFGTFSPWMQRGLYLLDASVVVLGLAVWRRLAAEETSVPTRFSAGQAVSFAVVWTGVTLLPAVLAFTAARLNHLPAVGVCLLAAWGLGGIRSLRVGGAVAILLFLLLLVNQGTSKAWSDAGRFERNVYETLSRAAPEWSGKSVIHVDTQRLQQRLTAGLLRRPNPADRTWWSYGNAALGMGFSYSDMLRLAQPDGPVPTLVLDTENFARVEGNELVWCQRWDPSVEYRTPLADVYTVDLFLAGTTED